MRLTTMSDYAMRLLMYLAHHSDQLCTIAEVAGAYRISEAHLMKITHQLGQGGFIETVRGKGGGMRLAAPPARINLGAVVRHMEPDFTLVECFAGGSNCVLTGHCQLAGIVAGALEGFLAHLDRHTLADLVPLRRASRSRPAVAEVAFRRHPRKAVA
jgi:Rrf2 family nitric oxide-sensitive transcriptional repressor